jgi:hypothetical protein
MENKMKKKHYSKIEGYSEDKIFKDDEGFVNIHDLKIVGTLPLRITLKDKIKGFFWGIFNEYIPPIQIVDRKKVIVAYERDL